MSLQIIPPSARYSLSIVYVLAGALFLPLQSCKKGETSVGALTEEADGSESAEEGVVPNDVLKRTSLSIFGGDEPRSYKRGTIMVSNGGKYGPEGIPVNPIKFRDKDTAFYFSQNEFGEWFYTYDGIGFLVPVPTMEEIRASRKAAELKKQQAKEDAKKEEEMNKDLARWQAKEAERNREKEAERIRNQVAAEEAERKRDAEFARLDEERIKRENEQLAEATRRGAEERRRQREEQDRAVAREMEETRQKLGQGLEPAEQTKPGEAAKGMPVTPPPKESPSETKVSPSPDKAVRLAEAKAELAALESRVASERQRWQQASDTINRLTNFKKTPVKEGSSAYQQCLAASRIIQEVEQKAPSINADRARLETLIKELEKN